MENMQNWKKITKTYKNCRKFASKSFEFKLMREQNGFVAYMVLNWNVRKNFAIAITSLIITLQANVQVHTSFYAWKPKNNLYTTRWLAQQTSITIGF